MEILFTDKDVFFLFLALRDHEAEFLALVEGSHHFRGITAEPLSDDRLRRIPPQVFRDQIDLHLVSVHGSVHGAGRNKHIVLDLIAGHEPESFTVFA